MPQRLRSVSDVWFARERYSGRCCIPQASTSCHSVRPIPQTVEFPACPGPAASPPAWQQLYTLSCKWKVQSVAVAWPIVTTMPENKSSHADTDKFCSNQCKHISQTWEVYTIYDVADNYNSGASHLTLVRRVSCESWLEITFPEDELRRIVMVMAMAMQLCLQMLQVTGGHCHHMAVINRVGSGSSSRGSGRGSGEDFEVYNLAHSTFTITLSSTITHPTQHYYVHYKV